MLSELKKRLDDCEGELEDIKKRIDKDKFDQMVMYLQRYAIIKACGTIEAVVKNMIADYVDANACQEIKNYIESNVRESSTNPSTGNIQNILDAFSSDKWKKSFEEKLKSHIEEKSSLNSLVQLRNDFAHGNSPNIAIDNIIRYYKDSRVIIELVEETILGT